uniref:Phosphorylated adapter RNA export protein n=1 Tax=Parastrongyloides trichosuri TaxID=131310 RepID=A0A0N4ZUN2_PARTI
MAFTQCRDKKVDWSDEEEECDMEFDMTSKDRVINGGTIWSDVITGQILEETAGATSIIGDKGFERDVESYSIPQNVKLSIAEKKETLIFDKKKFCSGLFNNVEDSNNDTEFGVDGEGTKTLNIRNIKVSGNKNKNNTKKPYSKNFDNQKKKSHEKNKGKQERYADKTILYKLPESATDEELVNALAEGLSERCVELVERAVSILGQNRCREIFEMVRNTELNGGMKTNNEKRRRSPGGIFIYHIKNHPEITKEEKKYVINPPKKAANVEGSNV